MNVCDHYLEFHGRSSLREGIVERDVPLLPLSGTLLISQMNIATEFGKMDPLLTDRFVSQTANDAKVDRVQRRNLVDLCPLPPQFVEIDPGSNRLLSSTPVVLREDNFAGVNRVRLVLLAWLLGEREEGRARDPDNKNLPGKGYVLGRGVT